MTRFIRLIGLALTLALALAAPALAQLAPEAGYVFPPGGRAGTTVVVQLGGYDWTPDMEFFVHDRRVKLEALGPPGDVLIPPPPYWFGARSKAASFPLPRETSARIVLPADVPPGPIRWQAANANGGTTTGVFIVGAGPENVEDERRQGAQTLGALPVTVNGRLLKNEEVDRYRFTARAAGPVTCDLMARRVGANFHGVLEVRDTAGRLVAETADTEGNDPALTFAAAAGAEYIVAVRDIDHAGDRSFVYRLTLTPGPRIVAAIPAAGRRGETREVEFVGYGVASASAQLESVKRTVMFPADLALASFEYRLETTQGIAAPLTLFVSDIPETVAPPQTGAKPVPLALPSAVTGTFRHEEAEHQYVLTGKKGDRWVLAVEARRLGSPLDVTLGVRGPDGKELARNDDLPGTTDAGLDFTVPADGAYTLAVGDTAGAGGAPGAVYRLTIRTPADDFTLATPLQRIGAQIGQKASLTIKATRTGGFAGPITLTVAGLPAGVRVPANLVIAADKTDAAIPLDVAADAPATAALVTITGTATIGGKPVTRPVRAAAAGNLAPRGPEDNEVSALLLATTLKPVFKGEPVDKDTGRKVPRGSTFPAEVRVERLGGFTGDVELKMASRQSYQVQGITGRDVPVPPGATTVIYPCYMPEWLESSKTSRMAMIAVAKVPDARGRFRHAVVAIDGMITMTMEGALLKVSHEKGEFTARPGQSLAVRVKVARSPRLPEPVRLELVLPDELAKFVSAKPVVVLPGQSEAEFVIAVAHDSRLTGEHALTIRASAMQDGNLAVISETTVAIGIAPAAAAVPGK